MLQLYIILIGFYRSFLTLTIIALTKIISKPLIINPLLENLLFNYSISLITILTVYFKQMQEGLLETILRVGQGFVMSGKRAFNYHESSLKKMFNFLQACHIVAGIHKNILHIMMQGNFSLSLF